MGLTAETRGEFASIAAGVPSRFGPAADAQLLRALEGNRELTAEDRELVAQALAASEAATRAAAS